MEPAPESFGDMLRRLRTTAALSQEELAERAGVSVRGISDLERGVRRAPRPETLRLLVDALNLTPQERNLLVTAVDGQSRTVESRATVSTLPLVAGPLFGRQEERSALTTLLLRPGIRLVTMTGTGGAGKTHLAISIASEIHTHFRDGAAFIDLSPVADAAHVLSTVGSTLFPAADTGQWSVAQLASRLGDPRMLLVLDNCEQILAAAGEISQLLAACPHLVIFATSRAPLGIRGEQEWPLSPLPVPDPDCLPPVIELAQDPVVALFVARARASAPRFTLTAENARAVVEICQQLEGLPLGIELAAARIKLLTPQELTARLKRRLPLLTGGPRDRPARQQTLRDAIAWSYGLLSPTEQTLFRHLGVFVGGWSADAAGAVAKLPGDVEILEGLSTLLDMNLIRVSHLGQTSRYSMLETIREFALDALAEHGESRPVQDRHAAYFLLLAEAGAEGMASSTQTDWRFQLEQEHPNLREALNILTRANDTAGLLRLVHALAYFWFMNTHGAEGLEHATRVLDLESSDPLTRARVLVDGGLLAYSSGEYSVAIHWFEEALPILQQHRDLRTLGFAWLMRGIVAERLGDEETTEACLLSGLALGRETNDLSLLGELLPNLSDAAYRRGDLEFAELYALEAREILNSLGNAYMECINLGNLAQVALARGDHVRAVELIADGLDLAEVISSHWTIANWIGFAAATAVVITDADRAALLLGASDAVLEVSGHPRMPHFALYEQTTARVLTALGEDRFRSAWNHGRTLPISAAIQMARATVATAKNA